MGDAKELTSPPTDNNIAIERGSKNPKMEKKRANNVLISDALRITRDFLEHI